MYKYQCSRMDCGTTWTLYEGKLNGFVLTCPICGKGRGLYMEQFKNDLEVMRSKRPEEITIAMNSNLVKSTEELNTKIEEFIKKYALSVVSKNIESKAKEVVCSIQYKLKE